METKSKRGFAGMTPERQREIAAMGGASVPAGKRGFSLNRDLAVSAGAKGGANIPAEKRSFTQNRALASAAGAKGGKAKGVNGAARKTAIAALKEDGAL